MRQKLWKGAIFALFFILNFSFIYSIEECKGETIVYDDVPCYILLPYSGTCNDLSVAVYNNDSLIYTISMSNFTASHCKFNFNQTELGTYSFLFSNGDTGNILVEVSEMIDIFHVMVYGLIGTLAMIFLIMMHVFKEDNTSMVYGAFSSVAWLILAVINISGFNLIRNMTFIIDVNYYITALCVIMCLYTGIASYFFYKENYKPKENPYSLRQ